MTEDNAIKNSETETTKKKKRKCKKVDRWFRFLRFIYVSISWFLLPYKKYGCKQKFNDRPYIFVGNHRSAFDVLAPVMVTDYAIHYMAKKELSDSKMGNWLAKKCECILVSRDGSDVRPIMQSMKYLKDGESVGIFPEGTRNKTEELFLPFKSGAAALSIKTKTPIIPILQLKTVKLFRKMRFYCGEPFELTEFYGKKLTQQDIDRADEIVLQKMTELYHELEKLTAKKKHKK